MSGWRFWIDRGGTFTDVIALAPDGAAQVLKLLSHDPGHYDDAVLAAVRRVLGLASDAAVPAGAVAELRLGTTVTTNALLERKGARTALLVTRGFGDLLEIGDQTRPELFALRIDKPPPLAAEVYEVDARIGADGRERVALDEDALRTTLERARRNGCEAVAIAFVHGAAFPRHEQRAAVAARALDFAQVCCSHEVSPLPGLLARAETAVLDAYLTPRLQSYVRHLQDALPGARLRFMQSSGGLVEAPGFSGRSSVLSGPAGGVIGAVRVGATLDRERLIGFDMGGTSTDVFHYAGTLERRGETRIAGVRLRVPLLQIDTVAAGGGSILGFDGARLRVGPESAGAVPGPACYRRGGPLALTDANLLLGRIQPAHFPAVFGPGADQPLDAETVHHGFAQRADQIAAATNTTSRAPEAIAWDYLQIAIENVVRAIRRVSVQRGIDLAGHALCAFGGAGGQHACLVADALGIREVLLHDQASLLSALGIGIADLSHVEEARVDTPLDASAAASLTVLCDELGAQARAALRAQGVAAARIRLQAHAQLRYEAAETVLAVAPASAEAMRAGFEQAHRARFGFVDTLRPIQIRSLVVEAVGGGGAVPEPSPLPVTPATPRARAPVWFAPQAGAAPAAIDTPLYLRAALAEDQLVEGPALLIEPHSTVVVEPGWCARRLRGALRLERAAAPAARTQLSQRRDPGRLEIFHNRFMAIAEQMGEALRRSARSVNVRERLDFSCAVFDARGRLVANAPHIPVHLGSMGASVQALLAEQALRAGEAWLINDPYRGGTHLPDLTVVAPVFDTHGRLRQLVAARAHHADVGGISPGSMPAASTRIDEEGLRFSGLRIVADGRFLEAELLEALRAGPWPARNPAHNVADLQAQLAATRRGAQALAGLDAEFGAEVVDAYMQHIFDHAGESVRALIPTLRAGRYALRMDGGRHIAVQVTPRAERLTIDFAGTSAQDSGNFNAPLAVTRAAVLYVLRLLLGSDVPLNDGCLAPVVLRVPEGSLLNPLPPAAVVAGNVETSQCVVDALLGAFGVLAGSQGTMNNLSFGDAVYQYYETLCGGAGAGPEHDGASAVHTHMTNSRITDAEILESRFPVRLERFAIRRGSGGEGRHRGGDGAVRELRFLAPIQLGMLSNRRETAAPGLEGGQDGQPGRNTLIRADGRVQDLGGCASVAVEAGDLLRIETPGGGGFGREE